MKCLDKSCAYNINGFCVDEEVELDRTHNCMQYLEAAQAKKELKEIMLLNKMFKGKPKGDDDK
jgi:hypothetical protein